MGAQDPASQGAWRVAGLTGRPSAHRGCEDAWNSTLDLLAVNLYPFAATVAKGASFADCIENIDIGGPAMIRAAAKNHLSVTVVVDSEDYAKVIDAMQQRDGPPP